MKRKQNKTKQNKTRQTEQERKETLGFFISGFLIFSQNNKKYIYLLILTKMMTKNKWKYSKYEII